MHSVSKLFVCEIDSSVTHPPEIATHMTEAKTNQVPRCPITFMTCMIHSFGLDMYRTNRNIHPYYTASTLPHHTNGIRTCVM